MKNQFVAGFLALTFGIIGLHKFYLGRNGAGWVRVGLLFIFPIIPLLVLISFIEAVQLFSMSEREFDEKYNREELTYRSGRQHQTAPPRQREWKKSNAHRYRHSERRQSEATPPDRSSQGVRGNPMKTTGIEKYKDYDYEGAIDDFNQALAIDPDDIATHFNIACAYSLTEQTGKALEHLDRAVRLGFKDTDKIREKEAFAFIRVQPEFLRFAENGYRLQKDSTLQSTQSMHPGLDSPKANLLDDEGFQKKLLKLVELRKKGVITEEEFQRHKIRLQR